MLVMDMFKVMELLSSDRVPRLLHIFCQLCKACTQGEEFLANKVVKQVKSIMGGIDQEFAGNKMQDASEFLCHVLD